MCDKFEGKKIYNKKDIHNLPTCVVVGNIGRSHITTINFDTLPRAEKLSIYYETFGTRYTLC